jgi:hypothetical protein
MVLPFDLILFYQICGLYRRAYGKDASSKTTQKQVTEMGKHNREYRVSVLQKELCHIENGEPWPKRKKHLFVMMQDLRT